MADHVLTVNEWNNSPLKFFNRYDGPYVNENVPLGNHALRKIFEKHFEYMSRNLYFISAFGRYLLGYEREDDVVKAETIAQNTINNAIASLQRKIVHAETVLNDAGVSCTTLYGKQKTMEVPITTPGAKLYLKLLTMADHYYSLNALLWMQGEIDSKVKFTNESNARKEIQGVVKGVASQFLFILKKTREKDANEAAKAGAHDEDALAKAAVAVVDEAGANSMIDNIDTGGTGNSEAATPAAEDKKASKKKSASKVSNDSIGEAAA